jgi:hypothetical protein
VGYAYLCSAKSARIISEKVYDRPQLVSPATNYFAIGLRNRTTQAARSLLDHVMASYEKPADPDFDERILLLYARGMTTREIAHVCSTTLLQSSHCTRFSLNLYRSHDNNSRSNSCDNKEVAYLQVSRICASQ